MTSKSARKPSGGVFDVPKLAARQKQLLEQSAKPDFWDRPDGAQAVLKELDRIKAHLPAPSTPKPSSAQDSTSKASMVGLLGGFLVGLTSIGSGSVIILLLFLFYRRPAAVMVGTDIFHAMILSAMLGLVHLQMGTVDLRLVGLLLAGAVVGVPLGSKVATLIPSLWLRRAVLVMLIPIGLKLL